jgi:integrase
MAKTPGKRRKKPRRGLGYTVETIKRTGPDGTPYRIRYRAYVWNAAAQVRQYVTNPETGGRTFDDWKDADCAAQVAKAQVDGVYLDAGIPVQRRRPKMTLDAYVAYYLETYPAKTLGTQRARKTKLKQACKRFPGKLLDEITEVDLLKWDAASTAKGLSQSTRTAYLVHLSVMYKRAVKEGFARANPCADVDFEQSVRSGAIRRLNEGEFQSLLSAAPEWTKPAMVLAFDAALRASEVAGLTWKRVHLDEGKPWVHIKDIRDVDQSLRSYPKGKGDRRVALSERLAEVLRLLKATRSSAADDDFVILHSWRRPLAYPSLLGRALTRTCKQAAWSGQVPRFHHLRHSCLMSLARATKDPQLVQAIAGHRSLKTTQVYFDDEFAIDEQAAAMALRTKMVLAENAAAAKVQVQVERGPDSTPLFMLPTS